ncbi:MAG: CoA-binding protein [Deltaproteobacteria bacterium]|nr:CoA-binding protein [Deltaproteobacteria bacterium]
MKEKNWTDEGQDLDLLFRPRSLAIIGVSRDPSRGGGFIWSRVQRQGYRGKKYPISISCTELDGVPCHRSVSDIGEPIDLAIAAIPAAAVESVLTDCAKKRIKFVVIHSAGFAELGEEGRALQERVLMVARNSGMRVVGPNCMGIFCPDVWLNTIVELEEADSQPGSTAFCGQSGWATEDFIAGGSARGLRFSTVISSGNQADLDLLDYVSYFGRDPSTRVICAYTEGIPRGRKLLGLASKIGRTKPLIIWKSGFSQAGARAALSHSGSIAGNRETWLGAARSSGIITAEGFEDLVDLAVAFSTPPFPKSRKVGIMAEAGGGAICASDACENLGLEVKPFSSELRDQLTGFLKKYLPPFSGTSNPLDLVWLPMETALTICTKCLELMASEIDSVIFMSYLPFSLPDMRPRYIETLGQLRDRLNLPIYVVPPYAARAGDALREFTIAGLPAFPSFERAARAISATSGWQAWVSSGWFVNFVNESPGEDRD